MYINPFLAGILATVIFEVLVFFGWALVSAAKSNKKK